MSNLYKIKGNLLALNGKLFKFPSVLISYIADIFGHGWDRNRAIDSIGNHGNALMGSYLLASSNLTISITGLLTTDTLVALTDSGLVGSINTNGIISFTEGLNYGAFEVKRAGALIGRYCLTEGSRVVTQNQYTGVGALSYAIINGTITTVWQKSNAYYSETNQTGYSIASNGWTAKNTGIGGLYEGEIIVADPINTTKCLAWVNGVQQDLQFIGKAQNSVSVVPLVSYFNADRYYMFQTPAYSATDLEITAIIYAPTISNITSNEHTIFGMYANPSNITLGYTLQFLIIGSTYYARIIGSNFTSQIILQIPKFSSNPLEFKLKFQSATSISFSVTDLITGTVSSLTSYITIPSINMYATTYPIGALISQNSLSRYFIGYISHVSIKVNGQYITQTSPDQYSNNLLNLADKTQLSLVGISTNLLQNVDLVYNAFNQTGYELWTNGTDYQIYPLASDGTRFITPSGYTIVETVTTGNMLSVADSRFTTFKYALANSYEVRKRVPEAYNDDTQATPKLLTYNELKDLETNPKIRITETDNKITNLKIKN